MAYKAQEFINAIPNTGGIISSIAKKMGCSWHTVQAGIKKFASVREAYNAECERMADVAEQVIMKSITGGDTGDAKWYLSRIRRGKYATKTETDITSKGESINKTYEPTAEERDQRILEILDAARERGDS